MALRPCKRDKVIPRPSVHHVCVYVRAYIFKCVYVRAYAVTLLYWIVYCASDHAEHMCGYCIASCSIVRIGVFKLFEFFQSNYIYTYAFSLISNNIPYSIKKKGKNVCCMYNVYNGNGCIFAKVCTSRV